MDRALLFTRILLRAMARLRTVRGANGGGVSQQSFGACVSDDAQLQQKWEKHYEAFLLYHPPPFMALRNSFDSTFDHHA